MKSATAIYMYISKKTTTNALPIAFSTPISHVLQLTYLLVGRP